MKKIYFVGIKGVGMTPLAIIAKQAGIEVAGSDVAEEFITDHHLKKAQIPVKTGFKKENIEEFFKDTSPKDILVITTGAHGGFENEQVRFATENEVTVWTQGKAVGEFMNGEILDKKFTGISVAGTHGKTTTTGMVVQILTHLKKDPTYIVGSSEIFDLGGPGKLGEGEYFVAEADEYISDMTVEKKAKLLYQKPKVACITNIDFDHPDIYNSIEDIEKIFKQFIKNLPQDSVIVANGDDKRITKIVNKTNRRCLTFGTGEKNSIQIKNIKEGSEGATFTLIADNQEAEFHISCSGLHNIYNAACALTALNSLGFELRGMREAIAGFKGTKRRGEEKGETKFGATVVDDYAHHPQEITTTLKGLRKKYNKKIVCIFQPHTYTRTKALIGEFADALTLADELILMPIFASARELDGAFTNEKYTEIVQSKQPSAVYQTDASSVIEYLKKRKFSEKYLIVTMGAGNVYKIADQITS